MKISIIMPVYNSSKKIIKALESFVPYMKDSHELIIIDDCSTDNTAKIIEKYQQRNSNKSIVIIKNSQNIGAGLSKNKGIKVSKGDFIGFIDSDDYVQKNYFNNMLKLAEKNFDIVVSDIILAYNNKNINFNIYENNLFSKEKINNNIISKELVMGHWSCASSCTKLFKRDIIKNLKFSYLVSDDLKFTIPAIINSKKIGYCKNNNYYYYQSKKSLTRTKSHRKYKDELIALFEVTKYLLENATNEISQIYSAHSIIPYICYSLKDNSKIFSNDIISWVEIYTKNYSIDWKNLITKNLYLKNSNLYNEKFYINILKYLENDNYFDLKMFIKKENKLINNKLLKKLLFTKKLLQKNPEKFKYLILKKLGYQNKNVEKYNPLVSIIIPVFNGENYIEEAIKSVIFQTYKNIEIIIVDDGSKDNTSNIVKKYSKYIKYFKKANGGVSSALNLGINKMQGEFFSWLSHDDLYFPDKIEKQVDFLRYQKNRNVVLFSDYILVNELGNQIGKPIRIDDKMIQKKPEYCLLRGSLNGITLLIPKKAFQDCGEFNLDLRCTQDYDMWGRIIKKYKFIHIPEVLCKTRIHSNQDTKKNPLADSEGDMLWLRMIEDISDERKIQLEGSLYNYYYKMAAHLVYSPYEKAKKHCVNKCKKINNNKYEKNPLYNSDGKPIFKEKNIFEKTLYCLKTRGFKETLKIIVFKLRGKSG